MNQREKRQLIWDKMSEYPFPVYGYKKGDVISKQAGDAGYIYYVVSGSVKISLLSFNGMEKILTFHHQGELIHEASFFYQSDSIASMIADEDCRLMRLSPFDYEKISKTYPDIHYFVFNNMARKIVALTYEIEQLCFFTTRERLIHILVALMKDYGSPCQGGTVRVKKAVTDMELAMQLGVRREIVTKLMSALRREGVLQKENHFIHILKPDRLCKMDTMPL